ncbi:MAG TPA: hypothetical protein VKT32_01540 [Chthonomonadaceae bacterium]|nr:hypothetical protein [Chthonomonadaceae bacterium]
MWMCNRCQAINDDDVTRCPKCGWEKLPKPEVAARPAAAPQAAVPNAAGPQAAPVSAPVAAAGADNRAAALTGGLLSPSEMMLFQGDRFVGAGSPMGARAPLIGRQTEVPNAALARVAVAIAFIANEHAGALRFSVDQQKGMLGLAKASSLYVRPTDTRPEWPAGCLEAQIVSMLGVPTKAGELVYALVKSDAASVESEMLGQIADGLRERGILEWENPNLPGLFWSTNVLTELGQLSLDRSVIAPVEGLVSNYRRNHGEMWKLLDRETATAFQRRHVG